ELRLNLQPVDARVELDGTVRTDNPLALRPGAGEHRLVVSAPGYVSQTRTLRVDADTALAMTLAAVEPPAPPPAPVPPPPPPPAKEKKKHHTPTPNYGP